MFTGIIEATAEVIEMKSGRLTLERPPDFRDVKIGSSISVSGACLTITKLTKTAMTFDVVPETLTKTTLGDLKAGDHVNLERAMRAGGRFEGHIVQGHVEGVGVVVSVSSFPQPLPPGEEGGRKQKGRTQGNILNFSREMRRNPTAAEKKFWQLVHNDKLGVRFRRQYSLYGFIVDFYVPSHRVAVEIDGGYHQANEDQRANDRERQYFLERVKDIQVVHFTNADIYENPDGVLKKLNFILSSPPPENATFVFSPPPLEEGAGEEAYTIQFSLPEHLVQNVIPKGSIALDGVALTVAEIRGKNITVALIPHTLRETTLGRLREGDRVNVETDIVGRYVQSFLPKR
jgi:riboflavin synthase alpha subunit/very-short-patch-repair endonuclease